MARRPSAADRLFFFFFFSSFPLFLANQGARKKGVKGCHAHSKLARIFACQTRIHWRKGQRAPSSLASLPLRTPLFPIFNLRSIFQSPNAPSSLFPCFLARSRTIRFYYRACVLRSLNVGTTLVVANFGARDFSVFSMQSAYFFFLSNSTALAELWERQGSTRATTLSRAKRRVIDWYWYAFLSNSPSPS